MEITDETTRNELIAEIERLNKYYKGLVLSIIHYYRRKDCQGELDNTMDYQGKLDNTMRGETTE